MVGQRIVSQGVHCREVAPERCGDVPDEGLDVLAIAPAIAAIIPGAVLVGDGAADGLGGAAQRGPGLDGRCEAALGRGLGWGFRIGASMKRSR